MKGSKSKIANVSTGSSQDASIVDSHIFLRKLYLIKDRDNSGPSSGFTLIEMLVVISIIGAIASILIGAITRAKEKSEDSAIKSNLSTLRTQAELFYDENDRSYATIAANDDCEAVGSLFVDSIIAGAISSSEEKSGNAATCYADADTWAISVPLKTDPEAHWCVDNTGGVGELADPIASTSCGL